MTAKPPTTAGSALIGFFSDVVGAALLRQSLYSAAAADPSSWRRAGLVVILAGLASDSLGLYTDLDEFLVRALGSWSLIPIMLLGLGRWLAAAAAGLLICRIFAEDTSFEKLLRCVGYGYAPAMIHSLPALVYMLDLAPVTEDMVTTVRWVAVPWIVSALTVAARAAGVSTMARAIAVAVVVFIAANLFDVLLDLALLAAIGMPQGHPLPVDALL